MEKQSDQEVRPDQKLYLVETKDEVLWSERKLDAIYEHVKYSYGRAKYKEVLKNRYKFPEGKKKTHLFPPLVEV